MCFKSFVVLWVAASIAQATPIRVLCWNIHHGVGEDGRLDLKRIAKVIEKEKPDLVALQEVDRVCDRSGKVDQAAELGRLLGMEATFGKALNLGDGGYGLAVLSKLPVAGHEVIRLPGGGEPRIALKLALKHSSGDFSFVSVHLDHQDEERRILQAEELDRRLINHERVILCGDFNAEPESKTMRVLDKWSAVPKTGARLTQPAGKPKVEIDHVFLRGFTAKGDLVVVEETLASDHRPLALTVIDEEP